MLAQVVRQSLKGGNFFHYIVLDGLLLEYPYEHENEWINGLSGIRSLEEAHASLTTVPDDLEDGTSYIEMSYDEFTRFEQGFIFTPSREEAERLNRLFPVDTTFGMCIIRNGNRVIVRGIVQEFIYSESRNCIEVRFTSLDFPDPERIHKRRPHKGSFVWDADKYPKIGKEQTFA